MALLCFVVRFEPLFALRRLTVTVRLCCQFPLPHSRGSSHGQSRVIRTAYSDLEQASMARRTRVLWRELEQRAGDALHVSLALCRSTEHITPLSGRVCLWRYHTAILRLTNSSLPTATVRC